MTPVIDDDQSDSAKLDGALELLVRGGRDVRHAQAMLVPQVWEGARDLDPEIRDFYRYHAALVEPWDGPAGLIFTDGRRVGASLDRNGLRPLRYHVCEDGTVVASSEVGAVTTSLPTDHPDHRGTVRRERLGPGQMLCVDPDEGGLQEDREIKLQLARRARPTATGSRPTCVPSGPACPSRAHRRTCSGGRSPTGSPRRRSSPSCGRWPRRGRRRPRRWGTTRRSRPSRRSAGRSPTTSSSGSRRSPTRPSTTTASPR
jgi:hypothetical protein